MQLYKIHIDQIHKSFAYTYMQNYQHKGYIQ